ncbi:uncharacterized protein LOC142588163 isoform X3 [Dermacentor variabilis]|uniref:uncharacterized protein LOC142588163 isoform X3 n=1 Tax=Dermacentor variabilis TaxID=34621 RepID=UPI003F5BACB2
MAHADGSMRVYILRTKLRGTVGAAASLVAMATSSIPNTEHTYEPWGAGFAHWPPAPEALIQVVEGGRHPVSGRLVGTMSWQSEAELLANGTTMVLRAIQRFTLLLHTSTTRKRRPVLRP